MPDRVDLHFTDLDISSYQAKMTCLTKGRGRRVAESGRAEKLETVNFSGHHPGRSS